MENLYNAVLSFKGEGGFTFHLPRYGELTIYPGKNIFIKGLDVSGVEALRELKPLLLEHKLNGKPDGCYKVIDLTALNNTITPRMQPNFERAQKSFADLKSEMIKSNGPIIEEPKVEEPKVEEPKVEEPKVEEPKEEEPKEEEPKETLKDKVTKAVKKNTKKTTRGKKSK